MTYRELGVIHGLLSKSDHSGKCLVRCQFQPYCRSITSLIFIVYGFYQPQDVLTLLPDVASAQYELCQHNGTTTLLTQLGHGPLAFAHDPRLLYWSQSRIASNCSSGKFQYWLPVGMQTVMPLCSACDTSHHNYKGVILMAL